MRILTFIGGYLPARQYGGPVTSVYNLTQNVPGEHYLVCSNVELDSEPLEGVVDGIWQDVDGAKVCYLPKEKFKESVFLNLIREICPDVAYLQGIWHVELNRPAIAALKKLHVPYVVSPRGDICKNAMSIGAWKKIPFAFFCKISGYYKGVVFHSTSEEETERLISVLGVSRESICEIPNLPGPLRSSHRAGMKCKNHLKVAFSSRICKKKNLQFAIKSLKETRSSVLFHVYGPIEEKEYFNRCLQEASSLPQNVDFSYRGPLPPEKAKCIFSEYDCFLFPTLSENYGHAIVESLLAECPVVISRGTTPWDDLDGVAGYSVPLGNPTGFARCIDKLASLDSNEYDDLRKNTANYITEKIDRNGLVADYVAMFKGIQ